MLQTLFDTLQLVWVQNVITTLILVTIFGIGAWMARKPYWINAAKQISHSWVARVSLVILAVFAIIATLDSYSWRDQQLRNIGKITAAPNGDSFDVIIEANRSVKAGTTPMAVIGRTGRRLGEFKPIASDIKTGDDPQTIKLSPASSSDTAWFDENRALIAKFDAAGTGLEVKIPVFDEKTGDPILEARALSILDRILTGLRTNRENDYSAPLATKAFQKSTIEVDGVQKRAYRDLRYPGSHILGTAKSGDDVFFICLKGIRTALIIGGVTTLLVIPLAMFFGIVAGYFGGWVDDVVQYVYSTLSSIPSILLMIAFMLVFGRGLPQLCIIMAITSWVGLCRLLRGETLKLREMEYVQASKSLGVPWYTILIRHISPNLMHLVIITFVLRFSGLVLSEAVLSYLNIGVDSNSFSWGQMIAGASSELTREPTVWWVLFGAFVFMFILVLAANLFADAVRDALDPRLRRL